VVTEVTPSKRVKRETAAVVKKEQAAAATVGAGVAEAVDVKPDVKRIAASQSKEKTPTPRGKKVKAEATEAAAPSPITPSPAKRSAPVKKEKGVKGVKKEKAAASPAAPGMSSTYPTFRRPSPEVSNRSLPCVYICIPQLQTVCAMCDVGAPPSTRRRRSGEGTCGGLESACGRVIETARANDEGAWLTGQGVGAVRTTLQEAQAACKALVDMYGKPTAVKLEAEGTLLERSGTRRTVLDSLVGTILSQNTTDVNSHRAFASLKAKFPQWADVLAAEPAEVVEAIRSGGLAETKTTRIQDILSVRAISLIDCCAAAFQCQGCQLCTCS